MTDKDRGLKVFRAFWNWNRTFHRSFNLSFDEFLKSYGNKADIYLDGIGSGIRFADVSDSRIDTAMRSMARNSNGQIPKNPLVMVQYLSNEAVKIDWRDAAGSILADTAGDLLEGAADLGNSLITTGKILNFLLPVIALVVVYYLLNKNTEGQFSKVLKGLK